MNDYPSSLPSGELLLRCGSHTVAQESQQLKFIAHSGNLLDNEYFFLLSFPSLSYFPTSILVHSGITPPEEVPAFKSLSQGLLLLGPKLSCRQSAEQLILTKFIM